MRIEHMEYLCVLVLLDKKCVAIFDNVLIN